MQEKRKNFMSEIRDALISGNPDEDAGGFVKKAKKKKKQGVQELEGDLL
jgi:hypothetical protein